MGRKKNTFGRYLCSAGGGCNVINRLEMDFHAFANLYRRIKLSATRFRCNGRQRKYSVCSVSIFLRLLHAVFCFVVGAQLNGHTLNAFSEFMSGRSSNGVRGSFRGDRAVDLIIIFTHRKQEENFNLQDSNVR